MIDQERNMVTGDTEHRKEEAKPKHCNLIPKGPQADPT